MWAIIGCLTIKAGGYMTQDDLKFIPHSDMGIDDVIMVNQHNNLIKNEQFSDATTLLDNNDYQKGFRASLFNSIQNKIRMIQIYLLNKTVADREEYYSYEEPSDEFMNEHGYKFWIQPYERG